MESRSAQFSSPRAALIAAALMAAVAGRAGRAGILRPSGRVISGVAGEAAMAGIPSARRATIRLERLTISVTIRCATWLAITDSVGVISVSIYLISLEFYRRAVTIQEVPL